MESNKKEKKNKEKKVKVEDSPKITGIKFTILAVAAIIIFSAAICPVTLQNDTFYTIKIGEHIVQNKAIDMQDPFSWHSDLPYTYPHWAYDVMIYLIYNAGGMVGIFISTVIFACILGITIYFTNLKISKNRLISFLLTLGMMFMLKDFIAARAQLVTFILFELTILLIEQFLDTKKKRYAVGIVLISIAIANLHCAVWPFFFVLFLPYIAEYLIFEFIDKNVFYKIKIKYHEIRIKDFKNENEKLIKANKQEKIDKNNKQIEREIKKLEYAKILQEKRLARREQKRENPYKIRYYKNGAAKWLILIMIICAFTGLLTPLGDTPYTYLYKTMQGNTTKSINEHLPLTLIDCKEMLITLVMFLAILIFTDAKIRAKDLFMLSGLALLMFMTRRQMSMFTLFGGAILAKMIVEILEKYDEGGTEEFTKIMTSTLGTIATMLLVILILFTEVVAKKDNKFISVSSYPVNAAEWIKENLDLSQIKLYNEYNYGSYLLYKEIPVFIDSRADLYAPEFNGERNEDGTYSGRDIFSDYIGVSGISKYYENVFENYEITHCIVYRNSKLNMLLSRDDKYKKLYSDDYFIIYERTAQEDKVVLENT